MRNGESLHDSQVAVDKIGILFFLEVRKIDGITG